MLDKRDIANALHILRVCIRVLEDPDGKSKGTRYVEAKQQIFLLKIAKELGHVDNSHLDELLTLIAELRIWESEGGVRTDEEGNLF